MDFLAKKRVLLEKLLGVHHHGCSIGGWVAVVSNAPSFAMKQTAPPSEHSISIINSLVDRPLARAPKCRWKRDYRKVSKRRNASLGHGRTTDYIWCNLSNVECSLCVPSVASGFLKPNLDLSMISGVAITWIWKDWKCLVAQIRIA